MKVYISGGSNIDPEVNIPKAIILMNSYLQIIKISKFYDTPPIDVKGNVTSDPYFVNFGILIETDKSPHELKHEILGEIELELGRNRQIDKFIPRIIDLDIIYFGELKINEIKFLIPDPEAIKYNYISYPMKDLNPNFVHPITLEKLEDIAKKTFGEISVSTYTNVILNKIKLLIDERKNLFFSQL